MSAKASRSNSVASAHTGVASRNLPDDAKPSTKKPFLSAERNERYARKSLAHGNFLAKAAGMGTAGPKKVGRKCGSVAGIFAGATVGGLHSAFSAQPAETRKKKQGDLEATVQENMRVLGGALVGGPFLVAGGAVNAALGGVAAGKLGAKYLDDHSLKRPAYSWRLKDDSQHEPGSEKVFEPRLPILHSRGHNERIGFGKYEWV